MDAKQKAARARAVDVLTALLDDRGPDNRLSVETFVDAIIDAAKPGLSDHAEAVEQARKERLPGNV